MSDKIKEVDVTLSNMDKVEKGIEKMEEVKPETINMPDERYGMPLNTLDARVALRNLATGNAQAYIGELTLSASTGNTVITGVGFTPSVIYLMCANGNNEGASWGFSDGSKNYALRQGGSGGMGISTTSCIDVQDVGYPSTFIGTISAISTDGFTININTQSGVPTLKVIYLAIG